MMIELKIRKTENVPGVTIEMQGMHEKKFQYFERREEILSEIGRALAIMTEFETVNVQLDPHRVIPKLRDIVPPPFKKR